MRKFLILLLCTCLLLSYGATLVTFAQEQSTTAQEYTQTSLPKSAGYAMVNPAMGYASGTLSIHMPEKHNAVSFAAYWGDAAGNRLPGYSPVIKQQIVSSPIYVNANDASSVPPEAKTMLVYTYSERFGESLTPYRIDLPAVTRPETGKKLAEFQIVSDLHVGKSTQANDRFVAMLKDVAKTCPDSLGIIAVGDLVNAADDEYYALLDSLYASVPDAPVLYKGIGCREYRDKLNQYKSDAHTANLQKFLAGVKLPDGRTPTTPYYSCTLGGQTLVFIGADSYHDRYAVYSDQQLAWLNATLSAADPAKPVFVFMHEPITDTVSGSAANQGHNHIYNDAQIKEIFQKYSNVYLFCGHSHWTLDASRTVYSIFNGATIFNTAAVSSLRNDTDGKSYELEGSQGLYVTVYEKAILVRGRDFTTGEWLGGEYYLKSTQKPPQQTETQTTKAPTTTAPTTTAPTATEQETESEEQESSKGKLLILAAGAAIVGVLAFVAVFGIQPKNKSE